MPHQEGGSGHFETWGCFMDKIGLNVLNFSSKVISLSVNFHSVAGTFTQSGGLEQFTRRKVPMPKVIGKEVECWWHIPEDLS